MRQSGRSTVRAIPEEALFEVERALEDLALAPRAEYWRRKNYIYIEIEAQRLCRLEYLSRNGEWALALPRRAGSGYGERGEAGWYCSVGNAQAMLLEAFKQHASRHEERRLQRRLEWLLDPPRWFRLLALLLIPVVWPLQWLLVRLLSTVRSPPTPNQHSRNL